MMMSVLFETLTATAAAGALSFACAGLVALTAKPHWVPLLVSYAIGALLGAVFLEILPHSLSLGVPSEIILSVVLGGILVFFMLEKMVLWRHDHGHHHAVLHQENAGHSHPAHNHESEPVGRTGAMIVIGDSFHNFVDGIIISAAFTTDPRLGTITALAIIAHEIPQETGDFLVLLHGGLSRVRALVMNLVSSVAMIVGGVFGCLALNALQSAVPYLLAMAASSMIYVAVADLIPGLHKRIGLSASLWQISLILMGVGTIRLAHWLIGEG
jgi:zinc and cadmium transporter